MRFLVAPDSFKGSLSAPAAAAAMAAGIRSVLPRAAVDELPLADGGEGTATLLAAATGGRLVEQTVTGPLGEPVTAALALLGDGQTAVVEMAAASGLMLVPPERRDPWVTSTYGTGELIAAAVSLGCRRLVLAIGGSATCDGGAGMAQALGVRLLAADGRPVPPGAAGLLALDRIDATGLDARLAGVEVRVACDVDNPLCGPQGAAAAYGPQKGATPEMIPLLDSGLARLAVVMARDLGVEVAELPGAGAAGGLGAGLVAFLGGRLVPGANLVLDTLGFDRRLRGATLVLTGEGRTDGQTLAGKLPLAVVRAAARCGVPTVLISGSLGPGAEGLLAAGATAIFGATPAGLPLAEAMADAGAWLAQATEQVLRVFALRRIPRRWPPAHP